MTCHCQGCGPAPTTSSDQPNSACLSGDFEGSARVADDSAKSPTQTLTSPQLCAMPRLRGVAVSFLRQVFILAKVTLAFNKNSSGVGAAFAAATVSILGGCGPACGRLHEAIAGVSGRRPGGRLWNKSITMPHVEHRQPHLVLMNSTFQMVTGLETYVQLEKTLAARVIFPDRARCCPVCFKRVINVCIRDTT